LNSGLYKVLDNRPVGDLDVGDPASLAHALESRDMELFALPDVGMVRHKRFGRPAPDPRDDQKVQEQ
jgi:hypothetical protein